MGLLDLEWEDLVPKFRKGIKVNENKTNSFMKFMYRNAFTRFIMKPVTAVWVSKASRLFLDSRFSKFMIDKYVREYNIDLSQCEKSEFKSFNDFFTRKLKPGYRPFYENTGVLCSPCDAKLSVYKIDRDSVFNIKDVSYTVEDLLRSKKLSKKYENGWCFIYRLSPNDYHRYSYIDNGVKTRNYYIKGVLHTVQPIAVNRIKVFKQNCREFCMLRTENFGDVVQIEVGALCVGKISNHHEKYRFKRGEEKGMFEFGGSTIIQLFERDTIYPDCDVFANTVDKKETEVKLGERVGYKSSLYGHII